LIHGRVDQRLIDVFGQAKLSSSNVQSSHSVAASINDDSAQEILKELPSLGPVTYLTGLEVLIADIERDGFDYLSQNPEVHAISDAELLHQLPDPLEVNTQRAHTSRSILRSDAEMFKDFEGKGITVGVMDTGIYRAHECFDNRVAEQINCVRGSYHEGDVHGHGTHVAGSIAGKDIGVASEASILDLRVFGSTTGASTSSILQALDVCIKRGVDIVNMSLGGNSPSRVLDNAVDSTVQAGVLACIAAGNSGPYKSTINSPASARLALAVGATDHVGTVTSFSSRGPNPWYSWPKPDIASFGLDVRSASHRGGMCVMSGTSMATPGVAGILACLLEHQAENPDAKAYIDALVREGSQSLGQSSDNIGAGFVTLDTINSYLLNEHGAINLLKKKARELAPSFFKKSVLMCNHCRMDRVVHQLSHRTDGTLRIRMSCIKDREFDDNGDLVFEDIVMENWKHVRISDKQFIQALRKCGGCGKRGLVPISNELVELPAKHHAHSSITVGCLYCNKKGKRVIPLRLNQLWGLNK
jgi:subtilisin family serine protease